jgi:hypothetical protein
MQPAFASPRSINMHQSASHMVPHHNKISSRKTNLHAMNPTSPRQLQDLKPCVAEMLTRFCILVGDNNKLIAGQQRSSGDRTRPLAHAILPPQEVCQRCDCEGGECSCCPNHPSGRLGICSFLNMGIAFTFIQE